MVGVSVFQTLRHAFAPADPNAIRTPVVLHAPAGAVPITLRTMTMDDEDAWSAVRWGNEAWLKPWESGDPMHGPGITFNQWMAIQRRNEERGAGIVFLIEHRMRIVGQISIGAITYGAMRTGVVGYWVAQNAAGHGIAPTALAMLADWAIGDPTGPRLHRLEIAILPENTRSLAVVRKVGARHEGLRANYMYVAGTWRSHETFSLLAEDMGAGFAARLVAAGGDVSAMAVAGVAGASATPSAPTRAIDTPRRNADNVTTVSYS
ncbi:acetyltransferase [Bifidobacterium stellenboschense]|uniref:Acetyltransferase n=1 Tax=Bifidobacterium stellenboschense TaxID=762211 RepID=A0A087DSV8_9BIFI|nr:acetyltransferase [Bifidobacterium stellenboschense]